MMNPVMAAGRRLDEECAESRCSVEPGRIVRTKPRAPENQRNRRLSAGCNGARTLAMISTFCRSIVVLTLTGLVAACAMTAEQQTARDDERCTARGLQPQSKAHDDCVLGLRASRDTREQQRHRDLVEQRAPTPYR
jgi:hypothetical protein